MSIFFLRKKRRIYLVSFFYFLKRILPISARAKYRLFLNLEWIFNRLSYELSVNMYDYKNHPVVTYRIDFLKKYIKQGHSVVDLGCGNGLVSFLVSDFSKKVVGIDYNSKAIENAKIKYRKHDVQFYALDAIEFLENNEEKYDVLMLSHILEHIDHPKEFLLQYKQYFDHIYIELPDYDGTILNHFRKDQQMDLIYTDADHVSEFDRHAMKAIFSECGIQILEAEYIFGIQRYWCKIAH